MIGSKKQEDYRSPETGKLEREILPQDFPHWIREEVVSQGKEKESFIVLCPN